MDYSGHIQVTLAQWFRFCPKSKGKFFFVKRQSWVAVQKYLNNDLVGFSLSREAADILTKGSFRIMGRSKETQYPIRNLFWGGDGN